MIKLLLKCICVIIVLCIFALPAYGQIDGASGIGTLDVTEPITVSRTQSAITNYGPGIRTVALPNTPEKGNILVVTSMHNGDGHTPQISGIGWTLEFERYNSISGGLAGPPNTSFRRGMAVWWKVIGDDEPTSITVSWVPDSPHRVLVQEFSAGVQETVYDVLTVTDGDHTVPSTDPEIRTASLGTTVPLREGDSLLIAIAGWSTGSETTHPTNVVYSDGFNGALLYEGDQAYNITLSSSFLHNEDGGENTSNVSWEGNNHKFMGGMLVFNVRQPPDDFFVYWKLSNKTVSVGWDTPDDHIQGDVYEVKLKWIETGFYFNVGETEEFTIDIVAPRVGHFDVYVRTKRTVLDSSDNEITRYSRWAVSSNYLDAKVNEENNGWRIYWRMAPPTGIIVD